MPSACKRGSGRSPWRPSQPDHRTTGIPGAVAAADSLTFPVTVRRYGWRNSSSGHSRLPQDSTLNMAASISWIASELKFRRPLSERREPGRRPLVAEGAAIEDRQRSVAVSRGRVTLHFRIDGAGRGGREHNRGGGSWGDGSAVGPGGLRTGEGRRGSNNAGSAARNVSLVPAVVGLRE